MMMVSHLRHLSRILPYMFLLLPQPRHLRDLRDQPAAEIIKDRLHTRRDGGSCKHGGLGVKLRLASARSLERGGSLGEVVPHRWHQEIFPSSTTHGVILEATSLSCVLIFFLQLRTPAFFHSPFLCKKSDHQQDNRLWEFLGCLPRSVEFRNPGALSHCLDTQMSSHPSAPDSSRQPHSWAG